MAFEARARDRDPLHDLRSEGLRVMHFASATGPHEYHLSVVPTESGSFGKQLVEVEECYLAALAMLGLPRSSAVFRRLFVSDAANQEERLRASSLGAVSADDPVAVSIVEQAPLPEAHLALWAWHLHDPVEPVQKRALSGGVEVQGRDACRYWLADVAPLSGGGIAGVDVAAQTRAAFAALSAALRREGASLAQDVIRTWVFVEDVDLNYESMVRERRVLFEEAGLGPSTHYIASTGIAGRRADASRLVQLEAYAVPGLAPEQLRFLAAPERLGRTDAYGVTFERGVQIELADRTQTFISGTASIDPDGRVVHAGDVRKQLARALGNVEALLRAGATGWDEVVQMIVYLRDPADRPLVEPLLEERFGALPLVVVHAPVCRPEWLVEVECIGLHPGALRERR